MHADEHRLNILGIGTSIAVKDPSKQQNEICVYPWRTLSLAR